MMYKQKKKSKIIRVIVMAVAVLMMSALIGGCSKDEAPVAGKPDAKTPPPTPVEPPKTYIWPFTGKETTDEAATLKRPIIVKIENDPAAKPQKGLDTADVVYETVIEGGETRFACIFQSQFPDECEPVRSARNSDVTIVPQYNGILCYSGSNGEVDAAMNAVGLDLMSHDWVDSLYTRDPDRFSPHNLIMHTENAYEVAKELGYETERESIPGLSFGPSEHDSAVPATEISIPFSGSWVSDWYWDSDEKLYYRNDRGEPHIDGNTDEQITSNNVVVMWAEYSEALFLDPAGNPTYNVSLNGTGPAAVFRAGVRIDGTWESDGASPPKFFDESGTEITLMPGQTWFQVPWAHVEISSSASDSSASGSGGENYSEDEDYDDEDYDEE